MTWNTAKEASLFNATFKVTLYSAVVSPSAAVTVTVNVFSPEASSVPPVTSKVASGSVGSTTTVTSVTPYSRSTTSPSTTSTSFTVNTAREASLFKATTKVTV